MNYAPKHTGKNAKMWPSIDTMSFFLYIIQSAIFTWADMQLSLDTTN